MKKKLIAAAVLLTLSTVSNAQGYYTRYVADNTLIHKAQEWVKQGEWRNGLTGVFPHESVNAVDFFEQYHKNPKQWDALFKWLSETDLTTISAGQHPIPGSKLTANVEDSENQPLEKRKSESHHHHIDFQFVVKGVERFGLIDHYTSKQNTVYKPDVVNYAYEENKTRFYDSEPQKFFLFFPSDWHIAKVATPTREDQHIRVVVVKLDYLQ